MSTVRGRSGRGILTRVDDLLCRLRVNHRSKMDIQFTLRIGRHGLMHSRELALEVTSDALEIVWSIAIARHIGLQHGPGI
jgi:hypothetical protein